MITSPRSLQFLGAQLVVPNRHTPRTPTRISAVYTPPARSPSRVASLYETLGVSLTATNQEIKAAYRRLARTCHPDVGAPADEFMLIHTAYSTLSDPGRRAEYDRAVLGPRARQASTSFSPRRTWETDQCW